LLKASIGLPFRAETGKKVVKGFRLPEGKKTGNPGRQALRQLDLACYNLMAEILERL
jgi:hypothetical protein